MERITLAMTGASGAQYGLSLLESLLAKGCHVDLLISQDAEAVINHETDQHIPSYFDAQEDWVKRRYGFSNGVVSFYSQVDRECPALSGASAAKKMIICPASGGTLSALACGMVSNAIERAGEVALKERYQLILVPRETPYSQAHLENMLKLTQMGAVIIPASPGFYQRPVSLQDIIRSVVERIVEQL